jgi:site-specific recombinase XerC
VAEAWCQVAAEAIMPATTILLPFQPDAMTPAQLAAVSCLARYSGHTHELYAYQLRRWFGWCEANGLDTLLGVQRAHVVVHPAPARLRAKGLLDLHDDAWRPRVLPVCPHRRPHPRRPAVYVRLPRIHSDETRTQGLDRLELIRFLQVAQTITVHHGALAYLFGINALRASEAAAVRIEDYRETLRGHRVLHLVGKGTKPATMPLTVPVLRVLEACRGDRTEGPLVLRPNSGKPIDRRDVYRMVRRIANAAGIPPRQSPLAAARRDHQRPRRRRPPLRRQILARHADPRTTENYDRARGNLDRRRRPLLDRLRVASV